MSPSSSIVMLIVTWSPSSESFGSTVKFLIFKSCFSLSWIKTSNSSLLLVSSVSVISPSQSIKIVSNLSPVTSLGVKLKFFCRVSPASIDIPINAVSFDAYVTSDDSSHEFSLISSQNINIGDRYFTANLPAMSLTSYVFQIDETLSENNNNFVPSESSDINIFPNPATSSLNINFTMNSNFNIKVNDAIP